MHGRFCTQTFDSSTLARLELSLRHSFAMAEFADQCKKLTVPLIWSILAKRENKQGETAKF